MDVGLKKLKELTKLETKIETNLKTHEKSLRSYLPKLCALIHLVLVHSVLVHLVLW